MQKTILNLSPKYFELANLELKHEFYFDGNIPNLELIPDPATKSFLKNYRLLLKQKKSSVVILQEGAYVESKWKPKVEIEGTFSLVFALDFKDTEFQIKTNTPLYTSKDQKFFIDLDDKNFKIADKKLEILPCYSVPLNSILDGAPEVSKILQRQPEDDIEVDPKEVANSSTGVYTLKYKDGTSHTFIWSNFDNFYDGFVSIKLNQANDNFYQFNFSSRLIFWEYILVSNYVSDLEVCQIVDDKSNMVFEFSENNIEKHQFLFSSSERLKLKERYDNILVLEKMGEKLKTLPFPELKNFNIKKDNVKNSVNKYFLSTYVNL